MPGIVGNALDPTTPPTNNVAISTPSVTPGTTAAGNTVYGADTATLTPTTRSVDQPNETVAGQLHNLLAEGSPYIQQARTQALEAGNARGLINSSITAGAGEEAAIKSALPIAQQDATTFTNTANLNQGYKNAAGQFNAGATNTSNLSTAQAANTSQISAQGTTQDIALQELKGVQAQGLADTEAEYKTLLQTSASAASTFNQVSANITAILGDGTTDAPTKQALLQNQQQLLQAQLAVIGGIGNVNLNALLTFA